MSEQLYRIDGVLWKGEFVPEPLCPKHKLEMDAYTYQDTHPNIYNHLRCEECEDDYLIPRDISAEKIYIARKLKSMRLKDVKVLNLDDEAVPIAQDKATSKNGKYFVTAILTESKVGQRLVVYAGEKGKKEKTQIFVEPDIKRIAFDQKDLNPSDVFTKLEGIFEDGTTIEIRKAKK